MISEAVLMKNGDKLSEPAAYLFFKQFSSLKTSLAVGGINAIEDATLLDLCRKYLKFIFGSFMFRAVCDLCCQKKYQTIRL